GQQHMARLLAEEGDSDQGRRGYAEHRTCRAVETARHVDRDARKAPRRHRLDDCPGFPADRTGEAGAEDRIDGDLGTVEQIRGQRLACARPPPGMMGGVAAQGAARSEQPEPHRPARGGEMAGRDEAITAIVPWTTQHRDGTPAPALQYRL